MLHLVQRLAPSFPWNSPYGFSENRVVDSRELEGLERISINSPYWSERWRQVGLLPVSTNDEVFAKYQAAKQLGEGMLNANLKQGGGLYSITDYYPAGRGGCKNTHIVFSPVMSEEILFKYENRRELSTYDKMMAWDNRFEDPKVGIPFLITVWGILATGGALAEAAPLVIAGTASTGAQVAFVGGVVSVETALNGLTADDEGNTLFSKGLEEVGMSEENAKLVVAGVDLTANVLSLGGSINTVVAPLKPLPVRVINGASLPPAVYSGYNDYKTITKE